MYQNRTGTIRTLVESGGAAPLLYRSFLGSDFTWW